MGYSPWGRKMLYMTKPLSREKSYALTKGNKKATFYKTVLLHIKTVKIKGSLSTYDAVGLPAPQVLSFIVRE